MKKMLFLLAMIFCLCAATAQASVAVIDAGNADRIHLREAGTQKSRSLGLYFTGTAVYVETEENSEGYVGVWVGNQTGYMKADYLVRGDLDVASAAPQGTVRAGKTGLLSVPEQGAFAMAQLESGSRLVLLGQTAEGWYYAYAPEAQEYGYVAPGDVRVLTQTGSDRETVQTLTFAPRAGEPEFTFELQRVGAADFGYLYAVRVWREGALADTLDFMSVLPLERALYATDVDMDGYIDLSVLRSQGAVDGFARHYRYRPQTQHFARTMALDDLSWYRCEFYPEARVIINYLHDSAATGIWQLYRWEGDELRLLGMASLLWAGEEALADRVVRYENGEERVLLEETWTWAESHELQAHIDRILSLLTGDMELGEPVYFEQEETPWSGGNG